MVPPWVQQLEQVVAEAEGRHGGADRRYRVGAVESRSWQSPTVT